MPTFNLADLFELVVGAVPDREALVVADGGRAIGRATYAELDARAERVAHVLAAEGVGPGAHVALHLHNGAPYVEAMLAAFKLRAVPVNCNFRYTADELAYVLADSAACVIVTEPDLCDVANAAVTGLGGPVRVLTAGTDRFDDAVANAPATPVGVGGRSGDDHFLLTTGGTTGRPKGVVWRHEDIYQAALGGRGTPSQGVPPVRQPADVVGRALGHDPIRRRLPLCPLIHGGGMWIALQSLLSGGTCVLSADRHYDATAALDLIEGEGVELVMVIGDAIARPLLDALDADPLGTRWPLRSLQVVASGGAILSAGVRDGLRAARPHLRVVDTFGASETGGQGRLVGRTAGGAPRLVSDADTAVFDDDGNRVVPGSGVVGLLARSGAIPLGYLNDPDKTAATFRVLEGRRWAIPGDRALVDADGAIVVLGRGTQCINTGGEKVFPEEVEAACKAHPAVVDVLVVGVPDDRFGEQVVAVVALRPGVAVTDEELAAEVRRHLAGYKVPRRWVRVPRCERLPTGKPDYRWARTVVEATG